ncbi:hypothetical protein PQR66_09530 [Paraburkholderia agricolaris]|uniref:Uncharacterized protein n=1 Tax=Paraburkholderia agricolaris TaxID=2152888 RepID=A0ABW8ZKV7_9BURK
MRVAGDSRHFYFGDALNEPLAESRLSVWSLSAGQARALGGALPDIGEIFIHTTRTVGTSAFGIPRYPGTAQAGDLPINYLKVFWPIIQPWVRKFCFEPTEWHVAYGLAIQKAMETSMQAIEPGAVVKIVMESAIPMSKIDPAEVPAS